jgi:hypothetical protein
MDLPSPFGSAQASARVARNNSGSESSGRPPRDGHRDS